ncbi:MAG: protein tyrosine phosphatase family protein [Thermodesulfobacteriota bacterium]|jgi:uncharacterized protein (TIGR01244 family)
MPERVQINDQITVGAQPSEAELKAMADEGTRTVINLRTAGESMQRMPPEEEGEVVRRFGMEYVHVPVSMEDADAELVDGFRAVLDRVPKPVYVHCRLGKRAGAFVMMDQAVEKGLSGKKTIQRAEEMGFECEEEALAGFVRDYVDARAG